MAIRLNCNVDDTYELLVTILRHTLKGERVMFLCDPARGNAAMARIRVRLSRQRVDQRRKGLKRKYFKLHNTIHPHTENGKRHDAVVVWVSKNQNHEMLETLEDLVGHGESL